MNFDDPRITAYALGELASAEDRAAVEQLLAEYPELTAELDETRSVADLLRRELQTESAAPLTLAQREEVLTAATHSHINGNVRSFEEHQSSGITAFPWWRRHWVPSAIAATVVLTTSIGALWKMQQPRVVLESVPQSDVLPAIQPAATAPKEVSASTTPPITAGKKIVTTKPAKEEIKRLYIEGKGFYDTGRYDLAFKRAEQVLNIDPYNIAAQKLQEEINKKRTDYASAGYNHTRSYTTWQVDKAWNRPVRKFASNAPTSSAAAPQPSLPADAVTSLGEPAALTLAPASPALSTPSSPGAPGNPQAEKKVGDAINRSEAVRVATAAKAAPAPVFYRLESGVISREAEMQLGRGFREVHDPQPEISKSFYAFQQAEPSNTESYDSVTDNTFLSVRDNPLSTFSIDVDTASYSNVRRFLTNNQRPPKGAVRIEELVNYFPYSYPQPDGDDPFSCTMEVAACPWKAEHRLVRVGLKGREIAKEKLPPSNLVFLIDVSGSMNMANKLPLVKECLERLVNEIREQDTVGIVVYAGSSGVVLEPTSDKEAIRSALDRLSAGGSTNGAAGIQAAYRLAQRAFKKDGNNRVVLATDGDFNVGVTSQSDLVDLIQAKAKSGVFLSVLGFGMGNTKDSTMEKLADKGNGNYAYIDSLKEGRKVLVEQMAGTLFTIAKDVKIQVEFNPAQVGAYRLIGYENRILAKEDFNDDKKDAGEIGAGHTVTALYEVVPTNAPSPVTTSVDPLKYHQQPATAAGLGGAVPAEKSEVENQKSKIASELLTLKLRFKQPDGDKSVLREFPLNDSGVGLEKSSEDFRWAAAVASFGMLLRDSPHRSAATWESVAELAASGKGADTGGYRSEFIQLIDDAKRLVPVSPTPDQPRPVGPPAVTPGKAAAIILPEFDVTDVPAIEAIDILSKKSREHDPEKKGITIAFSGGTDAGQFKVSLRLRNTSVLNTAKVLAGMMRLDLEEHGDILIFREKR